MPDDTIIPYTFKGQDLTGKRFGRLTVLGFVRRTKVYKIQLQYWYKCRCDCGSEIIAEGFQMKNKMVQSCGCLVIERNHVHGGSYTVLYRIWRNMKERCYRVKNKRYARYGGRGIRVLWNNFAEFRKDMASSYKPGLTLDRKDNDGHYCKSNCRWATAKEQCRNSSINRLVEFKGYRKIMIEWDEFLELPKGTTSHRLSYGWSIEKTLTTPMLGRNPTSNQCILTMIQQS